MSARDGKESSGPASSSEVDLDARLCADCQHVCHANLQLIGSHLSAVQGFPRTPTGPERVGRGVQERELCLAGRPSAPRERFLSPVPGLRPPPHPAPPPSIPSFPPPPPPPSRPLTQRPLPSPRQRRPPSPCSPVTLPTHGCLWLQEALHVVRLGRVIMGGVMGGGVMGRWAMAEGGVGWGGGGGAWVARGRRGHGARGGGWGSAAGAARLYVWRANAWHA